MIFDGKSTLGDDEFEREAVWIKEFNSNTNYNAIKIESITRECPDVSVDPVDPAASEEDKAIAQGKILDACKIHSKIYKLDSGDKAKQIKQIFEEDDKMTKFNANLESLEDYKRLLASYGGFNIYINNIEKGDKNIAILDYDASFHVETFTFDMREHEFSDLEIRLQEYEIENEDAGSKWNTFLDKIRPPPTAEEVVGGMKGEAI